MTKLSFHGAVGTVTGSKYIIHINDKKIMIDCGIFQGRKELRRRNWDEPAFDPKEIDVIILTHAHIDHIGFLPVMIKKGFKGKIYATPPTIDLAKILLLDAAHIQEEDAEYRNRKKITSHAKALPLFTTEDAKAVLEHFVGLKYKDWMNFGKEVKFRFHNAGHILGAASIEIRLYDSDKMFSILFSGDIGRYAVPLILDPDVPQVTDYLVCESTYGGEVHKPQDIFFEFTEILDDIIKRESVLLIPAFAVGRTQQILYILHVLQKQGRIPAISINVDSPMAVKVTDIYRKYNSYHQINEELVQNPKYGFYGKNVTLHRTRKASKRLNDIKGPAIILSASGMMTGGRIMHHLINRLPQEETTLLIPGYMADGTLGRHLQNGNKKVFIHKRPIDVKAKIINMSSLSGHACGFEIIHWLHHWYKKPTKVFITHGEPDRSQALVKQFKKIKDWDCYIPQMDESVEL